MNDFQVYFNRLQLDIITFWSTFHVTCRQIMTLDDFKRGIGHLKS